MLASYLVMKVTKQRLGEIAGTLISALKEFKVDTAQDITRLMNVKIIISKREMIIGEERFSNNGTTAQTISYAVDGTGIPLELKINPALNYTKIILKSEEQIPEYSPFMIDRFGNVMQDLKMPDVSMKKTLSELAKIAGYFKAGYSNY